MRPNLAEPFGEAECAKKLKTAKFVKCIISLPPHHANPSSRSQNNGGSNACADNQELPRLTTKDLCDLAARIIGALPHCREELTECFIPLTTLRDIRWALARRDFSP